MGVGPQEAYDLWISGEAGATYAGDQDVREGFIDGVKVGLAAQPAIILGDIVTSVDGWLDDYAPAHYRDNPLAQDWARLAKLMEESGEAVDKFIGITGNNPRKGVHGTEEEFLGELADVAATAILAIQHFTKEWARTEEVLWDKAVALSERIPDRK